MFSSLLRFQQPRPIDVSHKSKEFSTSSSSTSGNQCDTKSSASDPSYIDTTLFPVTCMYSLEL
jgi:hypothetical protein